MISDLVHRRNVFLYAAIEIFWGFGMAFASDSAILPVFLTSLGASRMMIGAIPAVLTLAAFAQLVSPLVTDRLVRTRRFVFLAYSAAELCWIPVILLTFRNCLLDRTLAWVVLLGYGSFRMLCGFASAPYHALIARTVLPSVRSTAYGLIFSLGMAGGVAGAYTAGRWLGPQATSFHYAVCFLVAFLLTASGNLFFMGIIESPKQPPSRRSLSLVEEIRSNYNFLRYLLARAFLSSYLLLLYFYIVQSGLPPGAAAQMSGFIFTGRALGLFVWGKVADRAGPRQAALGGAGALLAAMTVMIGTQSYASVALVSLLLGIALAAEQLSQFGLVVTFCPREDATSYFGILHSSLAPFHISIPLLGGWLIGQVGYPPVLWGAMAMVIAGASILALGIRLPSRTSALGR